MVCVCLNEKGDVRSYPMLVVHDSVSEGVWAIPAQKKKAAAMPRREFVK